ncbi:MAG TPA: hypothetical protein VKG78_08780 [Opitutaceae bacterium]|nr:hypothetical protein [Opitutaceae bacterium]
MLDRGTKALFAMAAAAALTGCSHLVTRSLPNADIGHYKHIFVEHRLADSYGIADEMARQLMEIGYDASAGALTMMPSDAELVVSYEDMWTWDFNTYMIEIDVQVRNARTDKILAVGHYYRPSMVFGHPPASMIHELLVKLFRRPAPRATLGN